MRFVDLHEDLLQNVQDDAGAGRRGGHGERREVSVGDVGPQLAFERDEAAFGLPQPRELQPRRRDVVLAARRERTEQQPIAREDEATQHLRPRGNPRGECGEVGLHLTINIGSPLERA